MLLLNEAGAAFDAPSLTGLVERLLGAFKGHGVIWALPRPALAPNFEHVMGVLGGKVVEQGAVEDLDKDGTAFKDLVAAS